VAPTGAERQQDKGTGEVIGDLWQLVRDYAKQETIDPLKSIGRFLGFGLAGAALLGLGVLFGALAILRGLQSETDDSLTGSLTWVPYVVAFVVSILIVALAVRAIKKPDRTHGARS